MLLNECLQLYRTHENKNDFSEIISTHSERVDNSHLLYVTVTIFHPSIPSLFGAFIVDVDICKD